MTKLPRLYVNGKFSRLVHPFSVSIALNCKPLSTATMSIPKGEELPARSWVELFTPYGSAGMFRVRSPHNTYGEDRSSAELEHMISEVGDWLVKAEYSEMVAASTAVSRIFSHYKGGKWKLGKTADLGSTQVALDVKYDNVLNALMNVLQQKPDCMMSFDFSTTPWTLNFVKKGTKVVSEGRLSRNVLSAIVTYDDSELCTRCWYQTFTKDKDGNITGKWTYRDADTVRKYGIVEGKVSTSSDMSDAEISYIVSNFLREHKDPRTSVRIQGIDLTEITGERTDKFLNGDLYRLAIPDYDLTVSLHISSISWSDVYGRPMEMEILLGDEEDSIVTFLHNLDATGAGTRGGGGGGGSKAKQDSEWKEYRIRHEEDDYHWGVISEHVDHSERVLQAAGIDVDSRTGAVIYAKDNKEQIGSRIKTESDRISLVVSGTGKDAKIKTASIITEINKETRQSSIKLSADSIDLDGSVIAREINTQKARIDNLLSGQAVATSINCLNFRVGAGQFTFGTGIVTKATATISGTTINYLKWG